NNDTVVDPASQVRFPLVVDYQGGLLTMANDDGFTIEFNGFPLPFDFFRVSSALDDMGVATISPLLNAKAVCSNIDFYGEFLQDLGYCNPNTDLLDVFGGAELRPFGSGTQSAPTGVGTVSFAIENDTVTAVIDSSTLDAAAHNFGLLVIDVAAGTPLPLDYTQGTTKRPENGPVETVEIALPPNTTGELRVHLMVDAYPAATGLVTAN